VATLLGVCPATVYRLCERGKLPDFRVLNAIRVDPGAVKRFLARARVETQEGIGDAAAQQHPGDPVEASSRR